MKVYELAKELGTDNRTIMEYLIKEGVEIKSHMSNVPDKVLARTREKFEKKKPVAAGAVGVPLSRVVRP